MTSFIKIHTVVRSNGRTGQFSSAAYTMPSTALQKSTRTSHPQVATVGGVVCLHLQHHIQNPGPSDRPSSSVHWMTPLSSGLLHPLHLHPISLSHSWTGPVSDGPVCLSEPFGEHHEPRAVVIVEEYDGPPSNRNLQSLGDASIIPR